MKLAGDDFERRRVAELAAAGVSWAAMAAQLGANEITLRDRYSAFVAIAPRKNAIKVAGAEVAAPVKPRRAEKPAGSPVVALLTMIRDGVELTFDEIKLRAKGYRLTPSLQKLYDLHLIIVVRGADGRSYYRATPIGKRVLTQIAKGERSAIGGRL